MTVSYRPADPAAAPIETSADRAERLRREAAVIAQANADIEAGLGIEDDELEAWLDRLDHDENAPLPTRESRSDGAPRRPPFR